MSQATDQYKAAVQRLDEALARIKALEDELSACKSRCNAAVGQADALRKELADLKVAMGEPVADLTITDDDFDIGLVDDYACGKKQIASGSYNLYAKAKP